MGRGHPTSRTPSYVTELEVLLEAKNAKIAELKAQLEKYKKAFDWFTGRGLDHIPNDVYHSTGGYSIVREVEALEKNDE